MPCKKAKALSLLKSGKAIRRRFKNGMFYIQLKFDPKTPIIHPSTNSLQKMKLKNMRFKVGKIRFDSTYLTKIRREAMRKHIWYKTLSTLERSILDLASKYIKKPKSPILIDILAKIVVKIKKAAKTPILRLIEQIGRPLAKKISQIAKKWGNKNAESWASNKIFQKYLTIIEINNIPGFRLSDTIY